MSPLLDVDALSVRFETDDGVVQAVDELSFELAEREVLGIVGESGCGKSVSLMSLLRLLPPSAKVTGTARFDGVDLLSAPTKQIRRIRGREIAFVFQEPMTSLNPSFRVGRQIAEVLERHLDLSRRAADRRAVELLDLVRIPAPDRRVREYPHQHDRHGARVRSEGARRGRADDRARRDDSGRDPRPDARYP